MATVERWNLCWQGVAAVPSALYNELMAAYAEPHRHYHTAQHLEECFAHFDEIDPLAEHPAEVALALWFHDAVYVPGASDNEARSAEWAARALAGAGAPEARAHEVARLVRLTDHARLAEECDERREDAAQRPHGPPLGVLRRRDAVERPEQLVGAVDEVDLHIRERRTA